MNPTEPQPVPPNIPLPAVDVPQPLFEEPVQLQPPVPTPPPAAVPKKRRTTLLIVAIGLGLLVLVSIVLVVVLAAKAQQQHTQTTAGEVDLNKVASSLHQYAEANDGKYPSKTIFASQKSSLVPQSITSFDTSSTEYTPAPSGCDNAATACTSFTLSAVFPDGKFHSVKN